MDSLLFPPRHAKKSSIVKANGNVIAEMTFEIESIKAPIVTFGAIRPLMFRFFAMSDKKKNSQTTSITRFDMP